MRASYLFFILAVQRSTEGGWIPQALLAVLVGAMYSSGVKLHALVPQYIVYNFFRPLECDTLSVLLMVFADDGALMHHLYV